MQGIFKYRYPKGYLWPYPGLPSLLVPYGQTSDFYISGHVGFISLLFWEYRRMGFKPLSLAFWGCIIVYLSFLLMVLRVHYGIGKPEFDSRYPARDHAFLLRFRNGLELS
jgi:hypothetical protein